jgi:hypothetical protein
MTQYSSDHLFSALESYKEASKDSACDEQSVAELRQAAADQLLYAAFLEGLSHQDGRTWLPRRLAFLGLDKDENLYGCYENLRIAANFLPTRAAEPPLEPLAAVDAAQKSYFTATSNNRDELSLLIYRADLAEKMAAAALSYENGLDLVQATLESGWLGKDEQFMELYQVMLKKMGYEEAQINTPVPVVSANKLTLREKLAQATPIQNDYNRFGLGK